MTAVGGEGEKGEGRNGTSSDDEMDTAAKQRTTVPFSSVFFLSTVYEHTRCGTVFSTVIK